MFNSPMTPNNADMDQTDSRPDLCHKCGKCCKSATTFHPYRKLQEMAEAGEEEAIAFLSVFKPFASIEEARKAVPEQVEQVLKVVAERNDMSVEDVTFYYCPYVTEDGICSIYERRPRCCRDAPYNGWAAMPPGCGYEGWQFRQREAHKSTIRKLKEVQFQMENLSDDGIHVPSRKMTLEQLRASVSEAMEPWLKFGSSQW